MKNKGVFSAAILTAVLCISGNLWAYSGLGDGSSGNPYQIADVNNFQQLSATPTDWSKSFILTANIDLTGLTFTQAPIAPDTDSAIEDFQGTQFTGVFDGNGHVIGYLTITAPTKDYVGLFGYIGSSGKIKNLGVKNATITGRYYVGGLVGYNNGSEGVATISNSYNTGVVTGSGDYVGGLVGYNEGGTVTDSFWDIETSGQETSAGGEGKTTEQMQTQSTFTDAGWDFDTPIWMITGQDYPRLIWNDPDIDNSDKVDFADFSILAGKWMELDCGFCDSADLTGDRSVNLNDMLVLAAHWLAGINP